MGRKPRKGPNLRWAGLALLMALGVTGPGAESGRAPESPTSLGLTNLFPDKVVARGRGVEVKQSQVDDAFTAYRASLVARGQRLPEGQRLLVESNLIDRLVVVQVLTGKATDAEKAKAQERADRILSRYRNNLMSDEDLSRQLLAMGLSTDQLKTRILEQATCEEVIDRALGSQATVTVEQARKYYEENRTRFQDPEKVKVSHILFSLRDERTNQEFTETQKREKRALAESVLAKARAGEDFNALVKTYSDDLGSKDRNGEYTFARGRMPSEFEAAAFTMKTNQISDLVTTRFGYHILKMLERLEPRPLPFEEVEKRLLEDLRYREIQKLLPDFLAKLKREAGVEILKNLSSP